MNTVIILGAGATRASGKRKPHGSIPPLDSDFFEIARFGSFPGYYDVVQCLKSLVGDYSKTLFKSLETATTYLYIKAIDTKHGSNYHKGFLDLLQLLTNVLATTTNDLKVGPRSLIYRLILSELKKLESPTNLTIITFNYDLLIERVLDEISSHSYPNSFSFPECYGFKQNVNTMAISDSPQFKNLHNSQKGIQLLKLHGSMNWQSLHTSFSPKPAALFNPFREIHIGNSPMIFPSLTWKRQKRTVYLKPVIIPPISGKRRMMHNSMLSIWDKSAEALRIADRVIIAGYSCPPLDLEARILLSENLRVNKNKKIYIIDPNSESASKFIDLCGVTHSTIYSSIKEWVNDSFI